MKGTDVSERLGGCFEGYVPECTMELVPRKEFFIKWGRSGDTLRIQTSDYLSDAPDSVLRGIALTVCRRLDRMRAPLPREFFEFVRSDGFITSKRPEYIRRSRNLSCSNIGTHYDI